jgi:hypothetical protein
MGAIVETEIRRTRLRQTFFNPALFLVGFMGHLFQGFVYGNNLSGHDNIIGKTRVKDV